MAGDVGLPGLQVGRLPSEAERQDACGGNLSHPYAIGHESTRQGLGVLGRDVGRSGPAARAVAEVDSVCRLEQCPERGEPGGFL